MARKVRGCAGFSLEVGTASMATVADIHTVANQSRHRFAFPGPTREGVFAVTNAATCMRDKLALYVFVISTY